MSVGRGDNIELHDYPSGASWAGRGADNARSASFEQALQNQPATSQANIEERAPTGPSGNIPSITIQPERPIGTIPESQPVSMLQMPTHLMPPPRGRQRATTVSGYTPSPSQPENLSSDRIMQRASLISGLRVQRSPTSSNAGFPGTSPTRLEDVMPEQTHHRISTAESSYSEAGFTGMYENSHSEASGTPNKDAHIMNSISRIIPDQHGPVQSTMHVFSYQETILDSFIAKGRFTSNPNDPELGRLAKPFDVQNGIQALAIKNQIYVAKNKAVAGANEALAKHEAGDVQGAENKMQETSTQLIQDANDITNNGSEIANNIKSDQDRALSLFNSKVAVGVSLSAAIIGGGSLITAVTRATGR